MDCIACNAVQNSFIRKIVHAGRLGNLIFPRDEMINFLVGTLLVAFFLALSGLRSLPTFVPTHKLSLTTAAEARSLHPALIYFGPPGLASCFDGFQYASEAWRT